MRVDQPLRLLYVQTSVNEPNSYFIGASGSQRTALRGRGPSLPIPSFGFIVPRW